MAGQYVSKIDQYVLAHPNTELIMSLGDDIEYSEAMCNVSADLVGFEHELQVMAWKQLLMTGFYNYVLLPIAGAQF